MKTQVKIGPLIFLKIKDEPRFVGIVETVSLTMAVIFCILYVDTNSNRYFVQWIYWFAVSNAILFVRWEIKNYKRWKKEQDAPPPESQS